MRSARLINLRHLQRTSFFKNRYQSNLGINTALVVVYEKLQITPKYPGDNDLHHAARHLTSIDALLFFKDHAKKMTPTELSTLLRQTNQQGCLPIEFILKNRIACPNTLKLYRFMIDKMAQPDLKPLNEPLTGCLQPQAEDEAYEKNLKIARQIINETRAQILHSSSHPSANYLPKKQRFELDQQIKLLREKIALLYPIEPQLYLQQVARYALKAKVGNCEELSAVALFQLNQIKHAPMGELYRIHQGDHCVLVIDRPTTSHPFNWRSWDKQTVICDAWSGDTFPATEIPMRLVNGVGFTNASLKYVSFTSSFNPNYHQLRPLTERIIARSERIAEQQRVINNKELASNSLFKTSARFFSTAHAPQTKQFSNISKLSNT